MREPAYPLATLKAIANKGPEYAAPHTIESACAWAATRIEDLQKVADEYAVTKARAEEGEDGRVSVRIRCEVCEAEYRYNTKVPDGLDPNELAHDDGCPVPGPTPRSEWDGETWRVVQIKEGGHREVLEEGVPAPERRIAERHHEKHSEGRIRLEREEDDA